MFQVILEQQFHYATKMTSNKHFSNAIYANPEAKLEIFFVCGRQQTCFAHKMFAVAKILFTLSPAILL